jgi:elongation factor P
MITAGEFRKGVTFEFEGKVFTIVDFQHVKPGKGAAFVRTKMKDVMDGKVLEKTWNPTEKVQEATIVTKNMTYSYYDGDQFYVFMEDDTFEQVELAYDQCEDALQYIKEGDHVVVKFFKGVPFSVECDNFVVLQVTKADPAVKGNTATNTTKKATLETGITIDVPMFVEEGEYIRVDTRVGEYMERVKG